MALNVLSNGIKYSTYKERADILLKLNKKNQFQKHTRMSGISKNTIIDDTSVDEIIM